MSGGDGSFELGTTQQKDEEKKRHTEKDLPRDNRIELEIYRRQKQDPFFRHYVQNEVKYFTDRISEGFMEIAQGFVPSDVSSQRGAQCLHDWFLFLETQ